VVKLAGAVIARKERTSSRGNRMSFIQLSDRDGSFEVTAFSETLSLSRELLDEALENGGAVLVTAEIRNEDGNLRITAQRIQRLDEAVAQGMTGFRIYLEDDTALGNLRSLIERQSKGRGRLSVVVDAGDQEVEIALPGSFALSPATRAAIKAVAGVAQVEEVLR
jgi:DNA polymerase-3 subunit alpha